MKKVKTLWLKDPAIKQTNKKGAFLQKGEIFFPRGRRKIVPNAKTKEAKEADACIKSFDPRLTSKFLYCLRVRKDE